MRIELGTNLVFDDEVDEHMSYGLTGASVRGVGWGRRRTVDRHNVYSKVFARQTHLLSACWV